MLSGDKVCGNMGKVLGTILKATTSSSIINERIMVLTLPTKVLNMRIALPECH